MEDGALFQGETPALDMRGSSFSPERAAAVLAAAGWLVLRVDCARTAGREGLFAAFAAALGRDYFAAGWDGFEDALRSLPCDFPASAGYAVLLEGYGRLLLSDPETAGALLGSAAGADASIGGLHGRRLRLFLF